MAACRLLLLMLLVLVTGAAAAQSPRITIDLNKDWRSQAGNDSMPLKPAFARKFDDGLWKQVQVPHNWDDYYGYRRLLHGNKHGDAWYRKTFRLKQTRKGHRFLLFFEGVGSYATVYLNEKQVGSHSGGRTSFTLDVTEQLLTDGSENILAVRAWHPPFIKDLPWVCGGCSDERGFSEGSQPMGIFRPVRLLITRELRITPFGVHAWATIGAAQTALHVKTTLRNDGHQKSKFTLNHQLLDQRGRVVASRDKDSLLEAGVEAEISMDPLELESPRRWSTEDPYLYTIVTTVRQGRQVLDRITTDFGFRTLNWRSPSHQLLINDQPVFINGIAGYEHLLGSSHAFSEQQVKARVQWIAAAGFNAFRDAHQPHNLLYGKLFNQKGILWWTQLSAHIWYDSPAFRENFKQLLREWVIERRNDPSVILWGLQNESKIPADFARECTELIRSLDPTASTQRLVTTCNGGQGTDWDVPQNWTGTYGGDPATYGQDLKKQVLVGEYGAWRSIDLHSEGGFVADGPLSEDRFTALMEQKVRLAESVKDSVAGHFFWLLNSHDNPGRVQGGEGLRELDRIGPVNYKGMLTPWEEPTDAYYMFRSNYVPASRDPMVYIASHSWPNRWLQPGIKDGIIVYSNCEEVELFNDLGQTSLGKRKKQGKGTHFQWDQVNIRYNLLYAVGYVNGKMVARDTLTLMHLPPAPDFNRLYTNSDKGLEAGSTAYYWYRLNCGGPDYRDSEGHLWLADKVFPASIALPDSGDIGDPQSYPTSIFSASWNQQFPELPGGFASQRRVFTPIRGSRDWKLLQQFRYGRQDLKYLFQLPNGKYQVELYFIEPWIGVGGERDGSGRRVFDVAFNEVTVLKNLDIWKEAGSLTLLKKRIPVRITNGKLMIHFPNTAAGQALISAIAISGEDPKTAQPLRSVDVVDLSTQDSGVAVRHWMDIGDTVFSDARIRFHQLPADLYGARWLRRPKNNSGRLKFITPWGADLYIAIDSSGPVPSQLRAFENTGTYIQTDENGGRWYQVLKKRFDSGSRFIFSQSEQWLVALRFPTNMQPAYDLKESKTYNADKSVGTAGVTKKLFSGRERDLVTVTGPVEISWPVEMGVADIYAITLKYHSAAAAGIGGNILLLDASGNKMLEQPLQFKFTRTGKWNLITVHTPGMVNAGHYKVVVRTQNAKGLMISNIDIQ
ncbi:hypothetical protein GCM10027051_24030 [Niabella terrae]